MIAWLRSRNPSRQPHDILVAHEMFQTVLVAEKLPDAKRHEPARPDHAVFECDGVYTQIELPLAMRAARRCGFRLFHAEANQRAVK